LKRNIKRNTTQVSNNGLQTYYEHKNDNKNVIFADARKDIEFLVYFSAVDKVEYLTEHKSVEHQSKVARRANYLNNSQHL